MIRLDRKSIGDPLGLDRSIDSIESRSSHHHHQAAAAAATTIRLSIREVYKIDTLKGKLADLVNPDVEFDIANRSGRSRAVGCCRDTA